MANPIRDVCSAYEEPALTMTSIARPLAAIWVEVRQ